MAHINRWLNKFVNEVPDAEARLTREEELELWARLSDAEFLDHFKGAVGHEKPKNLLPFLIARLEQIVARQGK